MYELGIGELLKQTTAQKKVGGWKAGLEFLIPHYSKIPDDFKPQFFGKLYTYFAYDPENLKMKEFIQVLIKNGMPEYDGTFQNYYYIIKDYESYKLTIHSQISKCNPNNGWQYCSQLNSLQNSLCNYYAATGLEIKDNASEYLYCFLYGYYFDVAGELLMYNNNFNLYMSHVRYKWEIKFTQPGRLVGLNNLIDEWFSPKSNEYSCLQLLKSKIDVDSLRKACKEFYFVTFPNKLGFKHNVLDTDYKDLKSFCLCFFQQSEFETPDGTEILDKIAQWSQTIASAAAVYGSDLSNEIQKLIIEK